jgi:hypothetical protein
MTPNVFAECQYAECLLCSVHYSECCYAECRHHAECRYADDTMTILIKTLHIMTLLIPSMRHYIYIFIYCYK